MGNNCFEIIFYNFFCAKCLFQHNFSKKVRKSLVLDPQDKEEVGAQRLTEDNSLDVQVRIKLN